MALSDEQNDRICKDFNDVILAGFEKGSIKVGEAQEMATFFLERLDNIDNENEVAGIFTELAAKWPIFANLKTIYEGRLESATEKEVATGVSALIQSGKIDDALKLAKTETQN